MSRLRYASPALQDLTAIAEYIARDNPVAADRIAERIETEILRIADDPERGFQHEDLPDSLLVSRVRKYLIIYRIESEGVQILRIIHTARDLGALFQE